MGDRDTKFAGVMSLTAAIAAAAAYLKKPVSAGGGELVLPDEIVNLIIAMAASAGNIDADLDQVITELQNLSINVQGFPSNKTGITVAGIPCPVANTAYRGPDIEVPEGLTLVVKNDPTNPFGCIIRVASSPADAVNAGSSYPLVLNDTLAVQVQNMQQIYVSSIIAGARAILSVEKA